MMCGAQEVDPGESLSPACPEPAMATLSSVVSFLLASSRYPQLQSSQLRGNPRSMGSDDDGALASYPLSGASSLELGIIKRDRWKLVELASRLFVAMMMGVCDVGYAAMVEVVGSSPACPWDCLGLFCYCEVEAAVAGPCGIR